MQDLTPGVAVIVVAAGRGTRLGNKVDKPYVSLAGKPLLWYCLQVFQQCEQVGEVILVVRPGSVQECRESFLRKYPCPKVQHIIEGGKVRQESVFNGLQAVPDSTDIVLVHDAARPFVTAAMVTGLIEEAAKGLGATVGMPVVQTIKRVDDSQMVLETPARKTLWEIQTPQAFKRQVLMEAHRAAQKDGVEGTDDAALLERIGQKVKVIQGSENNIKITREVDLKLAETLLVEMGATRRNPISKIN